MNPLNIEDHSGNPHMARYVWEDDFFSTEASLNTWLLLMSQEFARETQQEYHVQSLGSVTASTQFIITLHGRQLLSFALAAIRQNVVVLEVLAREAQWPPEVRAELPSAVEQLLHSFLNYRAYMHSLPAQSLPEYTNPPQFVLPPTPIAPRGNYNRTINAWAAQQVAAGRDREEVFHTWAKERNVNLEDRTATVQARETFKKVIQRQVGTKTPRGRKS